MAMIMIRRRGLAAESPGCPALRETASPPPVVAGGCCCSWPAFLMQDTAGHFNPIHAYICFYHADANTIGFTSPADVTPIIYLEQSLWSVYLLFIRVALTPARKC